MDRRRRATIAALCSLGLYRYHRAGGAEASAKISTLADGVKLVTDYAALRAYGGDTPAVRLKAEGIAGDFARDDSDTTSADNGGTIIVASNGERWKRVFAGALNVKWFGAKGDGATDDTAAIQKVLNIAGTRIFMPAGNYLVAGSLTRNSPLVLEGSQATIVIKNTQNSNGLCLTNVSQVSISGVSFSSSRAKGIYTQAITMYNCDNVTLRDIIIRGMTQFSIHMAWNIAGTYESVLLDNVHVYDAGNPDNGINNCLETIMRGVDAIIKQYTVMNCTFQTVDGTGGNIAKFGVGTNTQVKGCVFKSTGRTSASVSGGIEFGNSKNNLVSNMRFTMEDCIVTDNTSSGLSTLLLASCKSSTFSRCAFNNSTIAGGGALIYALERVIGDAVKFVDCFFGRLLVEGMTLTNINKIELVSCKFSYFTSAQRRPQAPVR